MKTILAKITGSSNDAVVLESSYLVASRFNSHIACLYVQIDSLQLLVDAADGIGFAAGTLPVSPQLQQALIDADRARALLARQNFDAFCKHRNLRVTDVLAVGNDISASWREVAGDARDTTIAFGRFHELVVVARSTGGGDLFVDDIGSLLMASGRPLLLAPSQPPKSIGSTIAVAWKETAEAAHAVTAAMPLLAQATKVIVLSFPEDASAVAAAKLSCEALAEQLRWHGVQTQTCTPEAVGQPSAQAIVATATQAGADLLVMGAYGHSRARELIFGGATRHVLNGVGIPVLLSH